MSNLAENLSNWNINNDVEAERAIQTIMQESAEAQRLINVSQTFINEYQMKIDLAKENLEKKTSWLKTQLASYIELVEAKATKTQKTYKLPSATLKVKFGTPEFIKDDEKLIEWLKKSGKTELVKTKETPDWAELKKEVTIKDGNVISADGEIIEGVTASERPNTFEIEF